MRATRAKISTTISLDNYGYLAAQVQSGKAATFAEALDKGITRLRRADNRQRLSQATAAYFENLPREALAEENGLGEALHAAARDIDFDREP